MERGLRTSFVKLCTLTPIRVYRETKTINGRRYKYLRTSVRISGSVVHGTVKYLGPEEPRYKSRKKEAVMRYFSLKHVLIEVHVDLQLDLMRGLAPTLLWQKVVDGLVRHVLRLERAAAHLHPAMLEEIIDVVGVLLVARV